MKRLSPPSRRMFSRLAAATAGALVVLAFASPASACQAAISGNGCTDATNGSTTVTWTVKNTNSKQAATILSLKGATVDNIPVNTEIQPNASVTGTEVFAKGQAPKLDVELQWGNKSEWAPTATARVTGNCAPASPSPSPTPSSAPSTAPSTAPSSSPSTAPSAPASAVPSVSPSAASGLPVTGAPTIAIISVAAVLIVGGGALLIVTRRRRSSNTVA